MYLYLMRHGETFWNKKGLIQGSSDIELTPYGEELARDTRDGFEKDQIHFSAFTAVHINGQSVQQKSLQKNRKQTYR